MIIVDLLSEVTGALRAHGASSCSAFLDVVREANDAATPPYVTAEYVNDYQRRAYDPFWLSSCLVANAVKEAEGAHQLAVFAGRIPAGMSGAVDTVLRHAGDEAKHARVFVRLLDMIFPDAELSPQLRDDLEHHLPSPAMKLIHSDRPPYSVEQVLDEISQINIGEIRTRINQLILRPVILAHTPAESRSKVATIVDNLLDEECQHIAYTAALLERYAGDAGAHFFRTTYVHRFQRFNHRTLCELKGADLNL